jgi:hypothetical protein
VITYNSGRRLFWYQMADVGAFYLYPYPDPEHGTDLVIVLVGAAQNPPSWLDLQNDAKERITEAGIQ